MTDVVNVVARAKPAVEDTFDYLRRALTDLRCAEDYLCEASIMQQAPFDVQQVDNVRIDISLAIEKLEDMGVED
jgi:hypothetical protein